MMRKTALLISALFSRKNASFTNAFVSPQTISFFTATRTAAQNVQGDFVNTVHDGIQQNAFHHEHIIKSAFEVASPSVLSFGSTMMIASTISNDRDIAFEDAFTDNIDLFGDTSVQFLFIGFGTFVILALVAKTLLNQMDSAIEKVLIEFESTMKENHASRWVSIEARLDGLEEPQRSQKLFEIMEDLQEREPDFFAKINSDISSSSTSPS